MLARHRRIPRGRDDSSESAVFDYARNLYGRVTDGRAAPARPCIDRRRYASLLPVTRWEYHPRSRRQGYARDGSRGPRLEDCWGVDFGRGPIAGACDARPRCHPARALTSGAAAASPGVRRCDPRQTTQDRARPAKRTRPWRMLPHMMAHARPRCGLLAVWHAREASRPLVARSGTAVPPPSDAPSSRQAPIPCAHNMC